MSPLWETMAHAPGFAPSLVVGLVGWLVWRLHRQRDQWRRRERIIKRLSSP